MHLLVESYWQNVMENLYVFLLEIAAKKLMIRNWNLCVDVLIVTSYTDYKQLTVKMY